MQIGFIGLGKMGARMAQKLITDGFEVSAWNRSGIEKKEGLKGFKTIADLIEGLDKPRVVWIMVPHAAVEEILTEVKKHVSKGDIVIDGGNSFFKNTDRRFGEFEKSGIKFLGIGVSGGIVAETNGYPMMVGGSKEAYDYIKPILDSLAKPNGGHEFFGPGGAGHFIKMVHNGIEYGMMQSLGEGFEVLEKSRYNFDLSKIANLWKKGTIISGFLTDRIFDALLKDKKLSDSAGPIAASGEGEWTILTAEEEGIDVPVIETSLGFREESQDDGEIASSFTAKVINALRREFGGHEISSR